MGGGRAIGTGYPIGKDLVLTARHVLFPHWNHTKEVEVAWADLNHFSPVTELVFDGGEACDIAVVRCQTPPQAHVSVWMLGRQTPNLNNRWHSLGYSRLGKDEDTGSRVLVSALGEFHHPKGTHVINLTSKSVAKDKDNWKGLSGAPVFQGSTLYAVIIETEDDREECFSAVYLPYLLADKAENAAFRQAVGLGSVEQDFREAIAHLQNLPDARKALLAELIKVNGTVEDSAKALVSCLVTLSIPQLLNIIHEAQKSTKHPDVFGGLRQLVRLLLPSLYGFDRVTTIRATKGSVSAEILQLPYATEMSAETLMAAVDKRAADFKIVELDYGRQVRAGKYRLPLAPESGADDGSQATQDVENDLYNRLCGKADVRSLRFAIDEHLFKINPRKQNRAYSLMDKKKLVTSWLEREAAKEASVSFYWLFRFGDDESENARMRQFAKELKTSYPYIIQLSLDGDVDRENEEYDLFDRLEDTQQQA
jgi:hypothetical protein